MKVLPFKIPKTGRESFRVQVDQANYFYDTLHNHDELQITFIVKSEGTLICGDYIGNFSAGDLFIIGSGQPHVLRNNKEYFEDSSTGAHAISLFFDKHSFGHEFFRLPELENLHAFLNRTQRGLRFSKSVSVSIVSLLLTMEQQTGLDRLINLLKVLQIVSNTKAYEYLASASQFDSYNEKEGKRMNQIFQFTMQEYHRVILLDEVASLANMTPNAFCRYFKQRTRKTYVSFLNEIRISKACELIKATELTVAQACYQSGFNNLSHFNRIFKKVRGCSPSEYAKKATHSFQ
ncbi:MAG: AraC-like DNA-binding protein [Flavobacteriaceae bacterium]|jgi:AraC-like DNA-binding protein